jgi:hypothetical protein
VYVFQVQQTHTMPQDWTDSAGRVAAAEALEELLALDPW